MLSVETALHLKLNVRSANLSVNSLLAGLERLAPTLEGKIFASVLERAQLQYLQAVREGKAPPILCRRCWSSAWVKRGCRVRKLKTSRGQFSFPLRQVSCRECGHTWAPFLEALGLRPWQRVSEELVQRLVGLVTDLSYQKGSCWGGELLAATLAPMTIWRAVQQRAPQLRLTPGEFDPAILVLDGTKVPAGGKERGEAVNLAFQVGPRCRERGRWRRRKRLVGLAAGGPLSWFEALPETLSPEVVVSDGGAGISEAVASRYPQARSQRCEWHLVYSLRIFLWRDGLGQREWSPLVSELRELLFGPLAAGTRREVVATWVKTRLRLYRHSRTLLRSALSQICYARPSELRTTSHAEREMRELNRRTDVGVRWSLPGVMNLLRLRMARRYNPDDYARLWPHRSELDPVEIEVEVSMN